MNQDIFEEVFRQQQRQAAQMMVKDYVTEGLPVPKAGDVIRCVFSKGVKNFKEDSFIFKTGAVYDVTATGIDAVKQATEWCNQPEEVIAKLIANMEERIAENANAVAVLINVRDRETGEVQQMSFPALPSSLFVLESADAVSDVSNNDLTVGSLVQFSALTLLGMKGTKFNTEDVYEIKGRRFACDCDSPECPGKKIVLYTLFDGEEEQVTQLPYSQFGIARLYPKA